MAEYKVPEKVSESKFDPYELLKVDFSAGQLIIGPVNFLARGKNCSIMVREIDTEKVEETKEKILTKINNFWKENPVYRDQITKKPLKHYKASIAKAEHYGNTLEISLEVKEISLKPLEKIVPTKKERLTQAK